MYMFEREASEDGAFSRVNSHDIISTVICDGNVGNDELEGNDNATTLA